MTTFDDIIPKMRQICLSHQTEVARLGPLLINRDLYGRICLLVNEQWKQDEAANRVLADLAREIFDNLGPHAFPADRALLFEVDFNDLVAHEIKFPIDEQLQEIYIVDRLATEGNWSSIAPASQSVPRIVYYSIKGGVGRSTALAVTAWALAEKGCSTWIWNRRVFPLHCCRKIAVLSSGLQIG
jgi:hypothetical protein